MIRLRPHHLLCILTYAGHGYSQGFVENFNAIIRQIAAGEQTIEIVYGPDAICAPLVCGLDHHCTRPSVEQRDRLAAESISQWLEVPIQPGAQILLSPDRLEFLRRAFAQGSIRLACAQCQWKPLCDDIAEQGFAGTHLIQLANC